MNPGRASKFVAWTVVVLWVLFALVPAGGLAVCVGSDGHIGLNPVAVSCSTCSCETLDEGPQHRGTVVADGLSTALCGLSSVPGDRCSSCTDLAFEVPPRVRDTGSSSDDALGSGKSPSLTRAVILAPAPAPSDVCRSGSHPPDEAVQSLALRARSTVVLLI